ncbi:MAG: hypothetical protein RLZZ501_2262 [Pseudomonadota bacterium]|jgi:hypothetical protein
MASTLTISEVTKWIAAIKLIDTDEAVVGGVDGVSNQQAIQLAARTLWLRAQIEAVLDAAELDLDTSVTTQLRDAIAALIAAAIDEIDLPGAASETVAGIVELATLAETKAGKDGERAVTPAGLAAALATISIPDVSGYLPSATFTAYIARAIAFYDAAQTWTKPQSSTIVTLTDAASIAWDLATGQAARVTIADSRPLAAPTNMPASTDQITIYRLRVTHGAAGTTLAFASAYTNVSALTLSTAAGAIDDLTFECDGTAMRLIAVAKNVGTA